MPHINRDQGAAVGPRVPDYFVAYPTFFRSS